jgi:hypothetical protein
MKAVMPLRLESPVAAVDAIQTARCAAARVVVKQSRTVDAVVNHRKRIALFAKLNASLNGVL